MSTLSSTDTPLELLEPGEMHAADRLTIAAGTAGMVLMERAAAAIVETILGAFPAADRIDLLAGPGNNGGDAYAAARRLADLGKTVEVYALTSPARLSGDARLAADAFGRMSHPLEAWEPTGSDLVVDGLFGAGLSRPVDGAAVHVVRRVNESGLPVVAIDLPSGVSGASGEALGEAIRCDVTVTFFRRKPGHLLEPGRGLCGRTVVADIGIADAVLAEILPRTFANEPALWLGEFSAPACAGHKYDRGHAVVFSGGATRTGAARLSASAALRGGAGLVTVFSPASALMTNAGHLTAIMLTRCNDEAELADHLKDARFNAFVLGPGFGADERARAFAAAVLRSDRRLVLDADGLTAFAADPEPLFALARKTGKSSGRGWGPSLVLTPHEGEFQRLFPDVVKDAAHSKVDRARAAAERSGAVVVFKGRDTAIAAPDGRVAINATGTPWLATAGTGDVLAGLVAARLAQGDASFEAACAAVWMHGRAAELFGPGLISEDLPAILPKVLVELRDMIAEDARRRRRARGR